MARLSLPADIRRVFLSAVLLLAPPVRADIFLETSSVQGNLVSLPAVWVKGEIRPGDSAKFQLGIEKAKEEMANSGASRFAVRLDSLGGDVHEAMKIGRLVRASYRSIASVTIGSSDVCVSACVFILAGGAERHVFGSVGIHRPILASDLTTDPSAQKASYRKIESEIRLYFEEMNIPTSLWDQMFRVPGEKVRYLSQQELQDLGLNENDPFIEEANNASAAKKQGISKAEFIQRRSKANAQCLGHRYNDYNETVRCYQEVMRSVR